MISNSWTIVNNYKEKNQIANIRHFQANLSFSIWFRLILICWFIFNFLNTILAIEFFDPFISLNSNCIDVQTRLHYVLKLHWCFLLYRLCTRIVLNFHLFVQINFTFSIKWRILLNSLWFYSIKNSKNHWIIRTFVW